MKILLVAKPWSGGLSRYVYEALKECYPGRVAWLPTAPAGAAARLQYLYNRKAWRARLVEEIASAKYLAALFIDPLPEFDKLPQRPANILWLTRGLRPEDGHLLPYGRVYVADPGYGEEVAASVGEDRFGGVLPFAHLPMLHQPVEAAGRKKTVCFIGNRDASRSPHLKALLAAGIPLTVVGDYFLRHPLFWRHPWTFWPRVANEKMAAIYARHELALNIHAAALRQGTNMRTFECAGYNIPQIIDYREGIEAYFEPGKEIEVYTDPGELPDKIRELATDETKRTRMANRARQRAMAEHTYQKRVRRVINEVLG